jgi:nucleolar protein 56
VTQDRQIIAAVEAIDDINDTANILAERLREWYLMFNETELQGGELAKYILKSEEPELKTMQGLAGSIIGLYEARLSIEEYLKEGMPQLAPNLTNIAGYILGARLLGIAGSLERLASMPSSTVQVIGANNALFKHLKGKAPSPKHGLIFRHPLINTAPKRLRGKIARAVASKISLAARYDYYSGELKENLMEELKTKVEDIKKRHTKVRAR